jgi:undecaprenyl-diphosphatase
MSIAIVLLLAIVQGAAELLPVSSSAHVILVEKVLGLDPSSPEMTFLLVMLHSGTMLAVLVYFWPTWRRLLSKEGPDRWNFAKMVLLATLATGLVGLGLQYAIEKIVMGGRRGAAVEDLFGNLWIIATGLAVAGVLIIVSGLVREGPSDVGPPNSQAVGRTGAPAALLLGVIQGLALPFRGFSRSGSTISVGLLAGMSRWRAEVFSFATAFLLTIPVVGREALRLWHAAAPVGESSRHFPIPMGLLGLLASFLAGSVAIRWLSAWLARGRWAFFGFYCVALSAVLFFLASAHAFG